ncbi:hypothetical protein [Micavibrio aeruginosavorus]|uniref:Uncharacterized protein n=1 Tax=Micavibrio aeruginosavorus EPB TaxID=349215 RepID=M4VHA5_9BACT|nr:hypothetical protein [Micavibrio aeruginosavorus]AGH98772.1 hypothetical protein A11S_1971 [Micavibrio aeruginosavorus EPB]
MTIEQALEAVYASLDNDNENIDECIDALKAALKTNGAASITVDPARLPQNNRQGRKMMQSYFKRRGVTVVFA